MKIPILIFCILMIIRGAAAPQEMQTRCAQQPAPLTSENAARYRVPRFEKVVVDKDIATGEVMSPEGKRIKILLDFYEPEGDVETRRPALLLIHGGGFKPGTTKTQGYIVTLAQTMARRGYVCIAVDYRVTTQPDLDWAGTMKNAVADVTAGLSWIREHAGARRIDQDHIAVMGGSAGGMIGLNFVSKGRDRKGIFAFINLWGSPNHQEFWPAEIDNCYPPTLTIHGTADTTVPFSASKEFNARLTSAGVRNLLMPLPDAPHTPLAHMDKIVDAITAFLFESLTGKEASR